MLTRNFVVVVNLAAVDHDEPDLEVFEVRATTHTSAQRKARKLAKGIAQWIGSVGPKYKFEVVSSQIWDRD